MQIPEALAAVAAAHAASQAAAPHHGASGRDPSASGTAAEAHAGPSRLTTDQILRSEEVSLSRLVSSGMIADGRGTFIISSNIAMLGALAAAIPGTTFFQGGVLPWVLLCLAAGISAISIAAAAFATFARTASDSGFMAFLESFSQTTSAGYYERMRALTTADYGLDLALRCHTVATVVAFKFRWIQIAAALLMVAAAPWLACLYLANPIPLHG